MPEDRSDPGELLARAAQEEAHAKRGRLKIFFGAAPGVGKTFAMLAVAQRLAREGVDVVVGLVETHGRTETEQQLLGLDILPRREVEYKGTTLREFDLESALARRPEVLLLDELAHTNAPGSRFEKRWQDAEELRKAGISVLTTLNVQHVESTNDVVRQITGVSVAETVPDSVLENADEIELVDLPPDALLQRLHAGKVYVPESIAAATSSFFRKGNLTALREISLRRTAEWVDRQMRLYRDGQNIRAIWPAAERILVAVSPSPASARIVRAAKRMATGLHADLIAAFVETPRTARLPDADRARVIETLRLAESLGASTTTLSGDSAAAELVAFARSRNVNKIVVGKTWRPAWRESLLGSFVGNLIRLSGEIDVYVIRGDADSDVGTFEAAHQPAGRSPPRAYAGAGAIVLLATLIGWLLPTKFDPANISMIYLAGVVLAAVWLGRGPSVLAAIVGVAAFDFFFVPPRLTFQFSDTQYVMTFAVMLGVGLLIANLTTRLRDLAHMARSRERSTSRSYEMARGLAAARTGAEVAQIAARHVQETFDGEAVVFTVSAAPALVIAATAGNPDWLDDREKGVAEWVHAHGKQAGKGTRTLPGAAARFLPLSTDRGKIGVLALRREHPLTTERLLLLDTFANQIALALERVQLMDAHQSARFEAESERMRSVLLRSVSHDLRTPLATIAGAAGTLQQVGLDDAIRSELTASIVREAERLNELIANLVFATRLEAGISLNKEWIAVEEIVGIGLSRHRASLAGRTCSVHLDSGLPLVRVDNIMLPQVVYNLVDNALRYTALGTPIEIAAWTVDSSVVIKVADEGSGMDDADAAHVFERFYRGRRERRPDARGRTGLGLGLTICEGIIKAHGGKIWMERNVPRGAAFLFSFPIDRANDQPMSRDDAE